MQIWQRAYLYVRRKAGKSVLLLFVMLLFSFVMAGLLLYCTTDLAIQQTRQSLGGSFRIAPDMQNRENVMIIEADGQTSAIYIGEPLDEALIQAVRAREGIYAHNAVLRGEVLLQEDLRLIDYNGIYQDDPIAAHLVFVEANATPALSSTFQTERGKLTAGELSRTLLTVMVVASTAVLSLIQALFSKSRQHELGIMLSVGISKSEILLQRFMEAIFIAAAALALSAGVILLIWPLIGKSIYGSIEPAGAVSAMVIFAATAGCGVLALLFATAFSNVGAMRLNPKEILSKLS